MWRPNRKGSTIGPRSYAKLLDAAYGALKSVSPRNIVIGGMTYTGGPAVSATRRLAQGDEAAERPSAAPGLVRPQPVLHALPEARRRG